MLQLQTKECQRISGKTPDARKGQNQTLSYRFQRVHCLAGVLIFILAFKTLRDNKFLLFFSHFRSVQFSSVTQSCPTLWDPMNRSMPALPITNFRSLLKLMPVESVMPSSHLMLCRPLLLLPPIPPSIRVFSSESTLRIRCPKY